MKKPGELYGYDKDGTPWWQMKVGIVPSDTYEEASILDAFGTKIFGELDNTEDAVRLFGPFTQEAP